MFRALSPNVLTYSVAKLGLVALMVAGSALVGCTSSPKGTPPPTCTLDACDQLIPPGYISNGHDHTQGWAFGTNQNGDLIIGRHKHRQDGYVHIELDETANRLNRMYLKFFEWTSYVPSELLACIRGTTKDKIGWAFYETDDRQWGGSVREIFIGFTDTNAKLKSGKHIKTNGQSHIYLRYYDDTLWRVDFWTADGHFQSESENWGCAQDLVPVRY